ncbi:chromatin complexes subunit BAP18-like isoform X2 [Ruditapes philippinarum]|uniref:chromatin complexes subunit BAP18-like isoform X2 n=1 Tax=Ruditapes philippinarum TaxID=129788 RepID=UPI00295BE551|nr:chromatin complexes subunit BAP18-like isoform X2 [Ruditapes philippinarum]
MSSASKVGEIFTAAGAAFSKLGELTMQLHPSAEQSPASTQIRTQLKRKAYEDAGLPPPSEPSPKKQSTQKQQQQVVEQQSAKKQERREVTLSALNAPESDVDIEGLGEAGGSKKLDFDSDLDSSLL